MIDKMADWLPQVTLRVVGDVAYIGKSLLKNRPNNVEVIGPVRSDAALTKPWNGPGPRKMGDRIPTPQEILDSDDSKWPAQTISFYHLHGKKTLTVKVVPNICWYKSCGSQPVTIVLIRDPECKWRDEFLLSTDGSLSVEQIIAGYCRRWSVEVAYADSKGMLGFHDPEVRCSASVQRAHPTAWFVGSLVVLWYTLHGVNYSTPKRHRPWYKHKPEVTFADMLSTCRNELWKNWLRNSATYEELRARQEWLLEYLATAVGT